MGNEEGSGCHDRQQAVVQNASEYLPTWVIGGGLVGLAIAGALFFHKIALGLAERAIGPRRSIPVQILEAASGPKRLAL